MLRRVDESRQPCLIPNVVLNQSPMSSLSQTALCGGLVVEVLYDSDQVCANVYKASYKTKELYAILCQTPFLNQQRRNRGLDYVGGTSRSIS